MRILVFTGTRPEIIKVAPVIKELQKRGIEFTYIHTGQHYDYEMSRKFIEDLELPTPNLEFKLENTSPAAQIGEIMIRIEKALERKKPVIGLVQGDTNSVLAAALALLRIGTKIGHIEAGFRSYDWRMPEEHNRRMVDHISDYLFAPSDIAKKNLEDEKVMGEIHVTGSTAIDAIDIYFQKIVEIEPQVLEKIKFDEFIVVTFHRTENVDDPKNLKNFIEILRRCPIPVVYPIHPRTKKRLEDYGLLTTLHNLENVQVMPPQGYFEFLALVKNSRLVMTDSGGIQEEATHNKIKKIVLVLRNSTEKPEAVRAGFAKVVGLNPNIVLAELEVSLSSSRPLSDESPFGDGRASKRIVDILEKKL